jgi:ATP-dependent Lon protease
MQDKQFPISGRNPQSAGASVKVDAVPCDFIFVGACNIQDLPSIISPLRSRIIGNGYEVLMDVVMPDTPANRCKLAQFMAQEIAMDTRIPPADHSAVMEIIHEAKKRAKEIDNQQKSLSLRLRDLGGLIRCAGDLAVAEGSAIIKAEHIKKAVQRHKTAEQQIKELYGSYYSGLASDISSSQKDSSPYNYWNTHLDDEKGYE